MNKVTMNNCLRIESYCNICCKVELDILNHLQFFHPQICLWEIGKDPLLIESNTCLRCNVLVSNVRHTHECLPIKCIRCSDNILFANIIPHFFECQRIKKE